MDNGRGEGGNGEWIMDSGFLLLQSSSGSTRRSMPLHNALKMDAGSPREIDVLISQGGMT